MVKAKFEILVLVLLMVCLLVLIKGAISLYPETMVVTDIRDFGEFYQIVLETSNGNLYLYETDDGDFNVGELYSVLMQGNGTKVVTDDKIVKLKYCGF